MTTASIPRTPLVVLSTFVFASLALGWVIAMPLVIMDPADRVDAPMEVYYNLFMLSPALAAVGAYLLERRHSASTLYGHITGDDADRFRPQALPDALGITPLRPVGRLIGWSILALLLFFAFSLAALPVGGALGVYPFDTSMPIFVQDLGYRLGHDPTEFIATGLIVEVGVIFGSAIVLVFLHAGQEMGWRGYLYPRVQQRWGVLPAVGITGVTSGLWYAPLLSVGFFYDQTALFEALALMLGFCLIIGGLLAWLRMRSGSIWPAAFAQSMITAATILHFWFAEFGPQIDLRQATLQGWSGWILPGLLLIVLLLMRKRAFAFPVR